MATSTGTQLAQGIRQKIEELKKACEGIDEGKASRAPSGRWSPKEILSHLLGHETGHLPVLQAFLDQDTPTLDLNPGITFMTEKRAQMSFVQLLDAVVAEYLCIAKFADVLTAEQLGRKAHIPMLKESPLGEYPTLGSLISGLGGYHVQFHINHMKEILQATAQA
jgi:hypothetical protein